MWTSVSSHEQYLYNVQYVLRKQLDSTTVQSQFFMEANEFILDLLRTGAVLPCTEIQQDVDLQETGQTEQYSLKAKGTQ